jgi:predicted metal-dependent hydrolase
MRQDGVAGARAWTRLLWYLWIRPGMFRKIAGAWLCFFLPGFHPWNQDDRRLLSDDAAVASDGGPKRKVRRAV